MGIARVRQETCSREVQKVSTCTHHNLHRRNVERVTMAS